MAKDRPLTAEVVDGELRISIGIEVLKDATERSPDPRLCWLDEELDEFVGFKICDIKEFAKDVIYALTEEEDGTNMLHTLLDNACLKAIEDGSLGVAEGTGVVKW
jgi:hypothetical protein